MKIKSKITSGILILVVIGMIIAAFLACSGEKTELKSIKSEKELEKIYNGKTSDTKDTFLKVISMPFSLFYSTSYCSKNIYNGDLMYDVAVSGSSEVNNTQKDYSKTNIQVENVDEADITKTDGDYIYSISDQNVVITDARDPQNIKIASKIDFSSLECNPEDLILYDNKLVVISSCYMASIEYDFYRGYAQNTDTVVDVFDISSKENPNKLKSYTMHSNYYTSRCIDNKLYVIASGRLRKQDNKIVTYYEENNVTKDISFSDIKRLKDVDTDTQTLISYVDLDSVDSAVQISSYLIDINNAYVSENNIYLLDEEYNMYNNPQIKDLWGFKCVIGILDYDYDERTNKTKIYKFEICDDGKIKYSNKTKLEGKTVDQYSLDEKNSHLRVALYDSKGTRVVVLDDKLNEIGKTEYLAKGEKMYSSRFMQDKVYLVTYKTIDPLFVIDLSDEENPVVLGKLKIPGYSTYLHPYDDNHLIGVGMETEEVVRKDLNGRVISTTAKITGMKMALFDVSDVNNPVQIGSTVIGDNRTTSAVLTNPKAFLFSKEKNLVAIPVNNYSEDFEIKVSDDESYDKLIKSYKNYDKSYIGEGYFVYNIDLQSGFNLKGIITHESNPTKVYNYNYSKMLRGMYIDDNLYTISENQIKVNKLDNLELVSELKIK